jgi:hypothetical protein
VDVPGLQGLEQIVFLCAELIGGLIEGRGHFLAFRRAAQYFFMRRLTALRAAADIGFRERVRICAGGAACHAAGVLWRSAGNVFKRDAMSARNSWTRWAAPRLARSSICVTSRLANRTS